MTHKTWPPPVGTLLILTDVHRAGISRWENGDVMQVVDKETLTTSTSEAACVTRVRDHGQWHYNMRPSWCRPIEETDNDQT